MEFLFADILFSILGRIALFLRFRSRSKVRAVLAEKYDSSYTEAGRTLVFSLIAAVLLFALIACILVLLILAVTGRV